MVAGQQSLDRHLPSMAEVAKGVREFNALYGEMEQVLWCLSKAAREDLLRGSSSIVVEELVWTIKRWWGVQGVRAEFKALVAQALGKQEWTKELFETVELRSDLEVFAAARVSSLVSATVALGAKRREYSLASKALHLLIPWRIPVYDSFVRNSAGVPASWDHPNAYRHIVHWEYEAARKLMSEGREWMGELEPISPFRAIDKYMWWIGGGSGGRAVMARDPWGIVRQLGINCS